MTPSEQEKYEKAKKRVQEIKGFYVHLFIYLAVNAAILGVLFTVTRQNGESFWQIHHFFTLFFWGLGLFFHALHTFDLNPFFGRNWEERQIRKYMEQDKEESKKYK